MYLHFLLLLLECTKASLSIPSSSLSSIIYLQCTLLMPGEPLPELVEREGMVEVPKELLREDTLSGFNCSKAAQNRAQIWNSGGLLREYLHTVHTPSDFITFVDEFLKAARASTDRSIYYRSAMKLVLKDGILLALTMNEAANVQRYYDVIAEVARIVIFMIESYTSQSTNSSIPFFLDGKESPKVMLPYKGAATPLGVLNSIRLVRLCEDNNLWHQFDTTEFMQFILKNQKDISSWFEKYAQRKTVVEIESWIKEYLSRRMTLIKRRDYLASIFLGMGLSNKFLQRKNPHPHMSILFNSLLTIDQTTFLLDYVRNDASSKESIFLEFLTLFSGMENSYHDCVEEFLYLWKEMLQVGLGNVLSFHKDFPAVVSTRIRIARIRLLLKRLANDTYDHELALLDRLEALINKV